MQPESGTFEWALQKMKAGARVARSGWNNTGIFCFVQFPDANSANNLPYIVMQKGYKGDQNYKRFPLDLSCESLFAEDWVYFNEVTA